MSAGLGLGAKISGAAERPQVTSSVRNESGGIPRFETRDFVTVKIKVRERCQRSVALAVEYHQPWLSPRPQSPADQA